MIRNFHKKSARIFPCHEQIILTLNLPNPDNPKSQKTKSEIQTPKSRIPLFPAPLASYCIPNLECLHYLFSITEMMLFVPCDLVIFMTFACNKQDIAGFDQANCYLDGFSSIANNSVSLAVIDVC